MKKHIAKLLVVMLAFACIAVAQSGPGMGMGRGPQMGQMPCPTDGGNPGMGSGGRGIGMASKWWANSDLVKKIGLSDSQVQQIEKIFQDHRMKLIDLHAAFQKQELNLQPLVDADRPDEAKVTAQIDQVAQARTNLEKSNAQMLLAIRRVLTVEQWKQLQAQARGPMRGPGMTTAGRAGRSVR